MKELTRSTNSPQKETAGISLNNLCFNYDRERAILTDVSLRILTGERVGLIGANGAGKTTLFMAVCGILTPSYGTVKILDRTVVPGEFNPNIGFIFQNPDDQLFCPTVRDDVAFGPENMGFSPTEVTRRVETALSLTGVSHLIDRIPHHLSGGEKCMVAIASVLAMQPQIILYDEPSANLDLKARRRLIQFLRRDLASTAKQRETASYGDRDIGEQKETIVVSSHDLELILEVCDRVILLNQGRIIADGLPEDIMSDRILMESNNLEVPHSLTHDH